MNYKNIKLRKGKIIKIGSILNISEQYLRDHYGNWLFIKTEDLPFHSYMKSNPSEMLRTAFSLNNNWQVFSKVCLRIVTYGTSEADVEHNFSLQREIQGNHDTNIGIKAIRARITLNQEKNKND